MQWEQSALSFPIAHRRLLRATINNNNQISVVCFVYPVLCTFAHWSTSKTTSSHYHQSIEKNIHPILMQLGKVGVWMDVNAKMSASNQMWDVTAVLPIREIKCEPTFLICLATLSLKKYWNVARHLKIMLQGLIAAFWYEWQLTQVSKRPEDESAFIATLLTASGQIERPSSTNHFNYDFVHNWYECRAFSGNCEIRLPRSKRGKTKMFLLDPARFTSLLFYSWLGPWWWQQKVISQDLWNYSDFYQRIHTSRRVRSQK